MLLRFAIDKTHIVQLCHSNNDGDLGLLVFGLGFLLIFFRRWDHLPVALAVSAALQQHRRVMQLE